MLSLIMRSLRTAVLNASMMRYHLTYQINGHGHVFRQYLKKYSQVEINRKTSLKSKMKNAHMLYILMALIKMGCMVLPIRQEL